MCAGVKGEVRDGAGPSSVWRRVLIECFCLGVEDRKAREFTGEDPQTTAPDASNLFTHPRELWILYDLFEFDFVTFLFCCAGIFLTPQGETMHISIKCVPTVGHYFFAHVDFFRCLFFLEEPYLSSFTVIT